MPPKSFKPDSNTDDAEIELPLQCAKKASRLNHLLLETMKWVPFAMQPSPLRAFEETKTNHSISSLKLEEIEPIRLTSIDWWHILDSTWAWQKSLGRVTCPFSGTFCTQFHHFLDGLLTFLYKFHLLNCTIFGVNSICFLLSFTHRFTKL